MLYVLSCEKELFDNKKKIKIKENLITNDSVCDKFIFDTFINIFSEQLFNERNREIEG